MKMPLNQPLTPEQKNQKIILPLVCENFYQGVKLGEIRVRKDEGDNSGTELDIEDGDIFEEILSSDQVEILDSLMSIIYLDSDGISQNIGSEIKDYPKILDVNAEMLQALSEIDKREILEGISSTIAENGLTLIKSRKALVTFTAPNSEISGIILSNEMWGVLSKIRQDFGNMVAQNRELQERFNELCTPLPLPLEDQGEH